MKKLFNLSIEDTTLSQLHRLAASRQMKTGAKCSATSLINEAIEKYLHEYEEILSAE